MSEHSGRLVPTGVSVQNEQRAARDPRPVLNRERYHVQSGVGGLDDYINTNVDVMADAFNAAARPFQITPPPPNAGSAARTLHWARQAVGAVGGVMGAMAVPAQMLDTLYAGLTAPLARRFPSLPAATMSFMHLGTPHGHMHPPSLIPPSPVPIPLPSFGVMLAAGCRSVLIGGTAAARCGDLGLALTCVSIAPPFEIFTGSSSVYIGGARAARLGDLTRHCNPLSALSTFSKAMALAGSVLGVANAALNVADAAIQADEAGIGLGEVALAAGMEVAGAHAIGPPNPLAAIAMVGSAAVGSGAANSVNQGGDAGRAGGAAHSAQSFAAMMSRGPASVALEHAGQNREAALEDRAAAQGAARASAAAQAVTAGSGGTVDAEAVAAAAARGAAEGAAAAAQAIASMQAALMAVAQAIADAAAFAMQLLCGKDPGIPPGVGALLGVPSGRGLVLIGGLPTPQLGAMAIAGVGQMLAKWRADRRARRAAAHAQHPHPEANTGRCEGGHPVDLVSGAMFDSYVEYVSGGPLTWGRYYDSRWHLRMGIVGRGFRHRLEWRLEVRLHRAVLEDPQGRRVFFPRWTVGATEVSRHGYVLRKVDARTWEVRHRREGTLRFEGDVWGVHARLVAIERPAGTLQLEYDAAGRMVALRERTEAAQRRFTLGYNARGQVDALVWTDAPGGSRPVARYAYDSQGRLTATRDAEGGEERYGYEGGGFRVTEWQDRQGYRYRWRYDESGRCVWTAGEDGQWETTFEYAPEHGVTTMTAHDGGVWTCHYDARGVVSKRVDPYGGTLSRQIDAMGRVLREVDSGGRGVDLLYDATGDHHARRDRFGHLAPPLAELRHAGNPLAHRMPETPLAWVLGGAVVATPDAAVGVDSAIGQRIPTGVHDVVATTLRVRPRGQGPTPPPTEQRADALGRQIHEVDGLGRQQAWRYDAAGNLLERRDRDGRMYRRKIVSWNLVGTETDPLGHATRYVYSPREKVTRVIDPGGTTSSYEYDTKDRLTKVFRHGVLREEYVYDAGDRLVEKRDARGDVLVTCEPHRNGLMGVRRLASGDTQTFDYDPRGRFTRAATTRHDVRLRTHDGRRCLDQRNGRGVEHRHVGLRLAATEILGRFVTSYRPLATGAGVVLRDPTGRDHQVSAEPGGGVLREWANGTRQVLQYDHEGRLLGHVAWRAGSSGAAATWAVRYEYTAEGDLVRVQDSARGVTAYTCDDAHRLVGERTPAGEILAYELDTASNLRRRPGLGWVELDDGNKLRFVDGESFAYDHRNHVAERTRPGRGTTRYVRDSLDQLIRIEDGGVPWTAEYDALGRRVRCGRGERQTEFYWDGDRLAAEIAPDGRLRVYVYAGHDALVPMLFVDYASADAPPESGRVYAVFHDQVGTPMQIEDANGRIVWWATRVDPYGLIDVHAGAEVAYALRWPGHYYDADTGLQYNRFRYYDPRLGRYLESDPLGIEGGVNLYAAPANPLVRVDLLGLTTGNNGYPNGNPPHQTNGPHAQPEVEGTGRRVDHPDYDAPPLPPHAHEDTPAFPHLLQGGASDEHAVRAALALRHAANESNRTLNAAKSDWMRRHGAAEDIQGVRSRARQEALDRGASQREASDAARDPAQARRQHWDERWEASPERQSHQPVRSDRSITVATHRDGTVSVGLSGSETRPHESQALVNALNDAHPSGDPLNPTYRASQEPVSPIGLNHAGRGAPPRANCSEAQNAETMGQNGSRPTSYQTAWGGNPSHPVAQRYDTGQRLGDGSIAVMRPCQTCQSNSDEYERRARIPRDD